ncbi:orotidine 5'-phosphate decarboxylase, partial [Nocardia tengchongensis]
MSASGAARVTSFGVRLRESMREHGPLCVGIDPHPPLLRAWGLSEDAAGVAKFADACVRAFAGRVALVKPQVAFFETYGSAGILVLEETIAALREAGTRVLADDNRGVNGSPMDANAPPRGGDRALGRDAV